jgi:NhaA family Na+:H+ antiporter
MSPSVRFVRARRLARVFVRPFERFFAVEAASSVVLLAAAALALVCANSPWSGLYGAFWSASPDLHAGGLAFTRDLRWWVNDGGMTLFFFVVGVELRHEVHAGSLRTLRGAALPILAALGGMIVPAAIYAALNAGHPTSVGWGIPMATDIAFAVGVLALLGSRVPAPLRPLLLGLAVIDDIGAILVIAFAYSGGVHIGPLAVAGAALLTIVATRRLGLHSVALQLPLAAIVWAATYVSGVHATLAGVAVGLLTPPAALGGRASRALHRAVAWGVMPVFAFANAGVSLGEVSLSGDGWRVFAGVISGLVVGKAVGVMSAVLLAARWGGISLPNGLRAADVSVVALLAGIGFTMALFIAQLAFPPGATLEAAKLAVVVGSLLAGVGGYALGRVLLGGSRVAGRAFGVTPRPLPAAPRPPTDR